MPLHSHAPIAGGVLDPYIIGAEVRSNTTGLCLATFDSHCHALRALSVAANPHFFPDWDRNLTPGERLKVDALRAAMAQRMYVEKEGQANAASIMGGAAC